jgi:hypothetical protein
MKKEKQLNNLKTIDSKIKYQDYRMMKKRIKEFYCF